MYFLAIGVQRVYQFCIVLWLNSVKNSSLLEIYANVVFPTPINAAIYICSFASQETLGTQSILHILSLKSIHCSILLLKKRCLSRSKRAWFVCIMHFACNVHSDERYDERHSGSCQEACLLCLIYAITLVYILNRSLQVKQLVYYKDTLLHMISNKQFSWLKFRQ